MEVIPKKITEKGIEILVGPVDRDQYYSVKECAEILKVTTKTIRNRVDSGVIKAVFHNQGAGQSQYLILKASIAVPTFTQEVVTLSRPISMGDLTQAVREQIRVENTLLRDEIREVRSTQERIENLLMDRDIKLMEAVRGRQREQKRRWWKFWA